MASFGVASLFWFTFLVFRGVSEGAIPAGNKNAMYNTPGKQNRTVLDG